MALRRQHHFPCPVGEQAALDHLEKSLRRGQQRLHLGAIQEPERYSCHCSRATKYSVDSRARLGGMSSRDHPESQAFAESRARHEIGVCGFDHTQKIGAPGGHAPQPRPPRCVDLALTRDSHPCLGAPPHVRSCRPCCSVLRCCCASSPRGELGGVGGIPSPGPCLLGRFSEAPNQHLVAGQEWPRGMRLSVVWGGNPPCPAQRVVTNSRQARLIITARYGLYALACATMAARSNVLIWSMRAAV